MTTQTAVLPATREVDMAAMSWADQYKVLAGLVYPRPIGLVSTLGSHGPNAAPFSFFNAIAVVPPMLTFSIGPKVRVAEPGAVKDTLANIRHCPEFVVHLVDDAIKEKMNICSVEHSPDVDEMALAGFRTGPSVRVQPPRILDAPVQFECKLHQVLELGRTPYYLVIGEVLLTHVREGVLSDRNYVDVDKLDLIGRIAGAGAYSTTRDRFTMHVPPD